MNKHLTFSDDLWFRNLLLFTAVAVLFVLGLLNVLALGTLSDRVSDPQMILLTINFLYLAPPMIAWFAFKRLGAVTFILFAVGFSVLTSWVTASPYYLIFAICQLGLYATLEEIDKVNENMIIENEVATEEMINERNDLEISYKEKGTNISVSFEKYASYYNLRNIANDFSTSLALGDLSRLIVQKTMELIQKGSWCLLFLAEADNENLSLMAAQSVVVEKKMRAKSGDIFDYWIVRNKKSLIIADTLKDFRFDIKKAMTAGDVRSLIASPISYEGKVVGTLRLTSEQPDIFSTDDLRLLDAVAMLASAAVSNAILFQRTEELAIRDSLTHLFVHRYFVERLGEEHRRSLLTNDPLTLLMCDIDHFKMCNDRYGHGVGDLVLMKTAELLLQQVPDGIVSRYGGEEFAILLPKTEYQEGYALGERIRSGVEQMEILVRREQIPITISIGVAEIPTDTLDSEELIKVADERLYCAKKSGRNRVC